MPQGNEWSVLRVGSAALLGSILCLSYIFFFYPGRLYLNYLCLRHAVDFTSCFKNKPYDFVREIEGLRYEGNSGNFVDSLILSQGAFEKYVLFFLRDTMSFVYSNQGTFIDVGANTGQHSLYLSRYASAVHAFEPWEPVLKRFRRMVEINHINNIKIHPVGLGDQHLKKPFYKPPDWNMGTGSFVAEFKSDNSYAGDLEIQTGDDALEQAKVRSVALIKMDIEGYEKLALRGLRRTLWNHRPIVVFEMTTDPESPVSIKNWDELIALFPKNFEFLLFGDKSDPATGAYFLQPCEGAIRFELKKQYDLVAHPIEKTIPRAGLPK